MAEGRSRSSILYNVGLVVAAIVLVVLFAGLLWRLMAPPDVVLAPPIAPHQQDLLGDTVKLQVLNGAGIPGAARAFTLHLRQRGYDVVESGDRRPFDVEQTFVIDRTGNREVAVRVARVLGLGESVVVEEINPNLYVHATVVIGRDFENRTNVSLDTP